jgi:hypothetical protein
LSWDTVQVKVSSPRLKSPFLSQPLVTTDATVSLAILVPPGSATIEAALFNGGTEGTLLASGSAVVNLLPGPNVASLSVMPVGATLGVVAGNGMTSGGTEGSLPMETPVNAPVGVAVHPSGGLLYVERDAHRVRMIPKSAGTYYGVNMDANQVYTVAGTGSPGDMGDGGPATSAMLQDPSAIALDASGSLYIADTINNRIRKVVSDGTITTAVGSTVPGSSSEGYPVTSARFKAPEGVLAPQGPFLAAT